MKFFIQSAILALCLALSVLVVILADYCGEDKIKSLRSDIIYIILMEIIIFGICTICFYESMVYALAW